MILPKRIALDTVLNKDKSLLRELAVSIAQGAVCIYPTETIYGIGGRYDDETVKKKIHQAKGRQSDQSMILLGATIDSFTLLQLQFPEIALKCARTFWPGLLTMVLPSASGLKNIAVRVTDHPFISAFAQFFDIPLFSTSANISGVSYNPDPDMIFRNLGARVDFMIDAGTLPKSLPSTIIQVYPDNHLEILREGCISSEHIFAAIEN